MRASAWHSDDLSIPDVIKPIQTRHIPIEEIGTGYNYPLYGEDIMPRIYMVAANNGKPGSGKTVSIEKSIKTCAAPYIKPIPARGIKGQRGTRVLIFSSTHDQDDRMLAIKKWMKDHSIVFVAYESIYEKRKDGKYHNVLEEWMTSVRREKKRQEGLANKRKHPDMKSVGSFQPISLFHDKPQPMKDLYLVDPQLNERGEQYSPYMVIFDDIAQDLRDLSIGYFLRTFRHYRCRAIVSSQYFLDAQPAAREIVTQWNLFEGTDAVQLQTIYRLASHGIDYPRFLARYRYATETKNGYLQVDVPTQVMKAISPHVTKVFEKQA